MNKPIVPILLALTLISVGLSIYGFIKPKSKTGYIYLEKVYDGFKAKKEIEKELKQIENKQTGILDTLKLSIADLNNKVKSAAPAAKTKLQGQLEMKEADYRRLVKQFSDYNAQESQKRIDGLLKQVTEYVRDYGKKNNYAYIYGATGNGSLMYANDNDDITEEVMKYVNKKYEGN
jgi:outer membrane protein